MRLSLAFGLYFCTSCSSSCSCPRALLAPLLIRLLVLLHVIWLFCRCTAIPLSLSFCLFLCPFLTLALSLSAYVWVVVRSGIFMTLVIKFNCCTFGARAHGASLGCGRGDITLHPTHAHTRTLPQLLPFLLTHPPPCPAMPANFQSRSQNTQVPGYVCCSAFCCF